jgi:hypothetical protein
VSGVARDVTVAVAMIIGGAEMLSHGTQRSNVICEILAGGVKNLI